MIELRQLLASLVLLCVASAGASTAAPLVVPKLGEIASIDATIANSYNSNAKSYRGAVHIGDQRKISDILGRINELHRDMTVPLGTFPTPTHTIVVNDANIINLVIFNDPLREVITPKQFL